VRDVQLIPLGVMAGLFSGKQIGEFLTTWAAVEARLSRLPHAWFAQVYWGSLLRPRSSGANKSSSRSSRS
jgi:Na+/H+ antiporter NhaA